MRKINVGDAVTAQFLNELAEVANWYRDFKARGEGGGTLPALNNHVTAKVRNDTGGAVRRGEVLEFTDNLLTDLDPRHFWFAGAVHDESENLTGWGIALHPIPSEKIGDCLLVGRCLAYVDVSDEDHGYADLEDAEKVLQSAESGPVKILWKPTGTGELECLVQIIGAAPAGGQMAVVKTASGWSSANYNVDPPTLGVGSGTVWIRNSSGVLEVTDESFIFRNLSTISGTGTKFVFCTKDQNGEWWLTGVLC